VEALICGDVQLSALERKMSQIYADAVARAADEHPPVLKAEQRGWIKGRDACWKDTNERSCVERSYLLRIAEIQARYRLVSAVGPAFYGCDGQPAKEVVMTFFQTDPATAIGEFGDSTSLMYVQRSASGSRYQGPNESFWEHQGVARITWGHGAPEMQCRVRD
jgi:uncharacterized protein